MAECPLCGGTRLAPRFTVRGFRIDHCQQCTHGFVNPLPDEAALQALYAQSEEDSLLANGFARVVHQELGTDPRKNLAYFRHRLEVFERQGIPRDARVLDFGCTVGSFVRALRLAGYSRAAGYDINRPLVEEGRKEGLDLSDGTLDDFLRDNAGAFDAVVSWNVLEHVADPVALMASWSRLLRPGGWLVLSFPNMASLQVRMSGARSPIIDPPHHVHYFSPRSIRQLFTRCGVELVDEATPFWMEDSDTYLRMKGVPSGVAWALRQAVSPLRWAVETLDWGGMLRVVGRSTARPSA